MIERLAKEIEEKYATLTAELSDPAVFSDPARVAEVSKALEAKFGEPKKSKLIWRPQNNIAVDDEAGEKILRLIGSLEDNDDVQNVYANFEVSDALMQKVSA